MAIDIMRKLLHAQRLYTAYICLFIIIMLVKDWSGPITSFVTAVNVVQTVL